MNPPKIPPRELFLRLLERPRPSEVVEFPRRGCGDIRIKVLTMREHDEARLRARDKLVRAKRIAEGPQATTTARDLLGDATARELLAMACVSVEPIDGSEAVLPSSANVGGAQYARIFYSAEQIAERLSADEVANLFSTYMLVQSKYGPYERNIETEEELSEWIRVLTEGARQVPFARLSSRRWAELITSLAQRVCTLSEIAACPPGSSQRSSVAAPTRLATGIGSPGEPPATPTPSGSTESLIPPGVELTMEHATQIADRMRGGAL